MPTPNELYAESACYLCVGVTQSQALMLALERRWLLSLNPLADTSPNALLQYGSCFMCYAAGSIFDVMETALLSLIDEAL